MRIGFLTYGLDRSPAGIGRYTVTLVNALRICFPEVEIVLLTTERQDTLGLWKRYEHHSLPGCSLLPALMTVGNVLVSMAVRRYRLDIIHDPNGIAPFLAPRSGARRVVTIHDAFAYVHPETHNHLDNWRYHWHLPLAGRFADAVITVSEQSKQDIIRYLLFVNNPVYAIYRGVDSRFRPIEDGAERRAILEKYGIRPPYIFYVGGLNARKNIARMLEAFATLHPYHPDVTLVIGGKRQWRTSEIDEAFQRLNLGDTVHFTGYVDDQDLPALYSAANLFLFPTLYEGFGLPPLEAMACGTPVVTSNLSSQPEATGDAALLVDPYHVDEIAAAVRRILEDRSLVVELGQRGLKRVQDFTYEREARKTMQVYEDILR